MRLRERIARMPAGQAPDPGLPRPQPQPFPPPPYPRDDGPERDDPEEPEPERPQVPPLHNATLSMLLSAALLMLASCAPKPTGQAYDQSIARQLSLARDCGADPLKWETEMRAAKIPVDREMVVHRGDQPSEQDCAFIRSMTRFAPLFEPNIPASTLPAKPRGRAAQAPGAAEPSYCADGSVALMMTSGLTDGQEALRARCHPGDTVIVPAAQSGVIASACDLSKPVVSAGPNVFCTLGRIRPTRAAP